MLERLVEQRKATTVVNTECQSPAELSPQQWVLAEKVIQLLKVFEEAIWEVSGEYINKHLQCVYVTKLKISIDFQSKMCKFPQVIE